MYDFIRRIGDEAVILDFFGGQSTVVLVFFVAVSIVMLSKGADCMVDGAVHLAGRTGLPKIVIGATIVSLGTTMPEAFVSVTAAWLGNPGLALGNGVGSIIADTGLIFGLSCLLCSIPVNRYILDRTGWVQVGSATLLVLVAVLAAVTGGGVPVLGRGVGVVFLLLLAGYLYMTYRWARNSSAAGREERSTDPAAGVGTASLMITGGLALVIAGARTLVPCASVLAHRMAVPEDVIAATMVAFGTSLPELITAVSAIRKGHPEITLGNIVGADVLNCLFVIGAAAAARPLTIPHTFYVLHFPAMLLILYSFRLFVFANRDDRFKRHQGAWLVCVYVVYVAVQYTLRVE